jgi:catechol 2,3-dioxygenase-like lactoylglutathione lyase family enzyme
MQLPARVGLITLACRDVERMAQLFRDLGWPETPESDEQHRTFQCTNGVVFGLYDAKHYEPELVWGGGFSWRDPEGNIWDVAWAKGTSFTEAGGLVFP